MDKLIKRFHRKWPPVASIGLLAAMLALLCARPAAPAAASAANLVANGDFETNDGKGLVGTWTTLSGWTQTPMVLVGDVTADDLGLPAQSPGYPLLFMLFAGPDNGFSNGFTSSSNGGYFAAIWTAAGSPTLEQSISGLTPGQQYRVSFEWAVASDYGALSFRSAGRAPDGTTNLNVDFGADSDSVSATIDPYGFAAWQNYQADFTAFATSHTLSFSTTPDVSAFSVVLIDNVVVTQTPNAIELATFAASALPSGGVRISWETASEIDSAGFNILRGRSADGSDRLAVNGALIAATGANGLGAAYTFDDATAGVGTWHYWLEEIDTRGVRTLHGPVSADVRVPTAVALSGLNAGNGIGLVWGASMLVVATLVAFLRTVRSNDFSRSSGLTTAHNPTIKAGGRHRSEETAEAVTTNQYTPPAVTTLAGDDLAANLGAARAFSPRGWDDEL